MIVPDADWTGLLMVRQPHASNVPLKLSFVPKLSDLFWRFTHLIACWKHIVCPDAQRAFVLPSQFVELPTGEWIRHARDGMRKGFNSSHDKLRHAAA
jgi:hypothetical protein